VLRVLLPAIAVGLLMVAAAWPQLRSDDERLRIEFAAVGPQGGSKPQVLNPRLLGVDELRRPFQVTADVGSRLGGGGEVEIYQLDQPKADIVLEDGSWVALTATDGVYDRDTEMLYLTGAVNLFHDSGYEFNTAAARVNLNDRSAEGDQAVHGQGPFGTVDAEGFRVVNNGDVIFFSGKARMTILGGQ
jgi:lipopolysaccharide export system protein LptC